MSRIYNSVDGKRFILLQEAHNDGGGYYIAPAISPDDTPQEDGWSLTYRIYWEILPEWEGRDERYACNWDEIAHVEILGPVRMPRAYEGQQPVCW